MFGSSLQESRQGSEGQEWNRMCLESETTPSSHRKVRLALLSLLDPGHFSTAHCEPCQCWSVAVALTGPDEPVGSQISFGISIRG